MANNKENPVVDHQDLLAQTYHIDGRVTAIEGQLQSFGAQLNRIEGSLLNKPPLLNFGNVMSMMLAVAGLLYGINGFVDLRLAQMKEGIERNARISDRQEDRIAKQEEFQRQMHYEVGKFQTRLDEGESRRDRNENWIRGIDGRVREVERLTAESQVSRRAIGDYAKELGKRVYGQ